MRLSGRPAGGQVPVGAAWLNKRDKKPDIDSSRGRGVHNCPNGDCSCTAGKATSLSAHGHRAGTKGKIQLTYLKPLLPARLRVLRLQQPRPRAPLQSFRVRWRRRSPSRQHQPRRSAIRRRSEMQPEGTTHLRCGLLGASTRHRLLRSRWGLRGHLGGGLRARGA